eukprot:5436497-Pleurochrysis_carterae.AAC.1
MSAVEAREGNLCAELERGTRARSAERYLHPASAASGAAASDSGSTSLRRNIPGSRAAQPPQRHHSHPARRRWRRPSTERCPRKVRLRTRPESDAEACSPDRSAPGVDADDAGSDCDCPGARHLETRVANAHGDAERKCNSSETARMTVVIC